MLEGIDTGYEEKFDFPMREGLPERPYLFASVPRSGSTYVSHLLWRTGCLGAPLEYLNFELTGPYGFASEAPARQQELWHSVLRRRTSPNGIFGLKAFPTQLEEVHRQNPRLMAEVMRMMLGRGPGSKVVQLRRRDRTAHAISMARAMLSGIWRKEQEGEDRPEPEYSELAVSRTEALIEQQEQGWAEMYRGLGISPLVVSYEDVLADPQGFVAAVAGYLGVELDPAAAIAVPEIEQQSQKGAQAWAVAHSKA
jgi:LPS sulfotransferase NodH